MIRSSAQLSIQRIPIDCIHIVENQVRYPNRCLSYVQKLLDHPGEFVGLLSVAPSKAHPGMFALLDGHHRFCAYILAGRGDALCVVIEEPKQGT